MKKIRFYFLAINKWTLWILFNTLILTSTQGQSTQPLEHLLDTLEKRYGIVFSYANATVEGRAIKPPNATIDLPTCLAYLTTETQLIFEQLDDRFIAIREPSTPKKLCGYLIDKTTGEPVVSAIVSIGDGFKISDEDGFFEFRTAEGQEQLSITHIGYYPLSATFRVLDTCGTITLTPKISELETIYVSNYLARGISLKTYGDIQVKTHELQVLPGLSEPDVLYTMQVLPGIQSPNESVSDINIRGGTNDQNLILFDGIKMYQTSHFYGLISAFNPYFTETVTLTKNGSSARLGDGVSGTLDIQSDRDVSETFSGGAGINLLSADVFMDIPISEKASISLSTRRSVADVINTPTYDNYFDRAFRNTEVTAANMSDSVINSNEDFQFYDLSATVAYHPSEKDQFNFSVLNFYNDLNYNQNTLINAREESRTSELTQSSLATGIQYTRRWTNSFITEFNSYLSSYTLTAINNDILNDQRLRQENGVLEFAAKLHVSYLINRQFDIQGGLQYIETGVSNLEDLNNPDFRRLVKEVVQNQSAYLEGHFSSLSNKSNLRFGLRTSYYDPLQKILLEPRLAVQHELLPKLTLELLGEYKNQVTTQIIDLQNDFLGVEKRRWVVSDGQDIPIIQSKQASIGMRYARDAFLLSVQGYTKLVDGIITSSQSFRNQFEFLRSTGEYRINGLEFLMNQDINQYSGWISYSLAKNQFDFPQLAVNAFPNNLDILHNLTVGVSYVGDHLELSSSINWHSGRPYTPVDPNNPIAAGIISYQRPNSGRLMDYLRVDFSGKYRFNLAENLQAIIGFSIWNLTNYTNILNTYYRIDENKELREISERGLDFTPNAFFRIRF